MASTWEASLTTDPRLPGKIRSLRDINVTVIGSECVRIRVGSINAVIGLGRYVGFKTQISNFVTSSRVQVSKPN